MARVEDLRRKAKRPAVVPGEYVVTIQAIFMVEADSQQDADRLAEELSDAMQDGVMKRAEVRGVRFASDEADFEIKSVDSEAER